MLNSIKQSTWSVIKIADYKVASRNKQVSQRGISELRQTEPKTVSHRRRPSQIDPAAMPKSGRSRRGGRGGARSRVPGEIRQFARQVRKGAKAK